MSDVISDVGFMMSDVEVFNKLEPIMFLNCMLYTFEILSISDFRFQISDVGCRSHF